MKKHITFLTLLITLLISLNPSAHALTGTVNGTGVRLRKDASSSSEIVVNSLPDGASLTINGTKAGSGCSTDWYNVKYNSYTGYICGEYVNIIYDANDGATAKTDYEKQLQNAGFPSSYWPYLTALHNKHSSWVFKAINTKLNFDTVANKESSIGVSLIQGDEGYRNTSSSSYNYYTNKWKVFDGSNWYAANKETVSYYLDPRNFLSETAIFMFEDLSYNSSYQTQSMVEKILSPTKLKNYDSNYAEHFMQAASSYKVSPIYLASRVRQEVGSSTAVISGAEFTYNSKKYSKLYNPYNIGATSGADNWKKGLVWAGTGTSYGRPWNTLEKGIKGGAQYIATGYINAGQNTNYLQRFNVANGLSNVASHQYMTNIMAPYSEANSTYEAYKDYGVLNSTLVFSIPVYTNMPSKTSLPSKGNPNNYLKSIKIDNVDIVGFDGAKTDYTVYVPLASQSVDITATKVVSSASVSGTGKLNLTSDTTVKNIAVKAQNGSTKTYKITIIKSKSVEQSIENIIKNAGYTTSDTYIKNIKIGTLNSTVISKINGKGGNISIKNASTKKTSNTVATGDTVTISNGKQTKSYTVIVSGDANGDGKINAQDYTSIKREKTKNIKIQGYYRLAADVNGDNKITSVDYVNIKNYILGGKTVLK